MKVLILMALLMVSCGKKHHHNSSGKVTINYSRVNSCNAEAYRLFCTDVNPEYVSNQRLSLSMLNGRNCASEYGRCLNSRGLL